MAAFLLGIFGGAHFRNIDGLSEPHDVVELILPFAISALVAAVMVLRRQ